MPRMCKSNGLSHLTKTGPSSSSVRAGLGCGKYLDKFKKNADVQPRGNLVHAVKKFEL